MLLAQVLHSDVRASASTLISEALAVEATLAILSASQAAGDKRVGTRGTASQLAQDEDEINLDEEEDEDDGYVPGGGGTAASSKAQQGGTRGKGRAASKLVGFSFPTLPPPPGGGGAGGGKRRIAAPSPPEPQDSDGGDHSSSDDGSWHTATPSLSMPPKQRDRRGGRDAVAPPPSVNPSATSSSSVLAEKLVDMRQRAEKWKARCAQLGDQLATLGGTLAAKVGGYGIRLD